MIVRESLLFHKFYNLKSHVNSWLNSMAKSNLLNLRIPKNVYLRTELICKYIEDKFEVDFDIANFIMILYLNFLDTSVERYEPKKIQDTLTRSYGYDDNEPLIIHDKGKYFKIEDKKTIYYKIEIEMDKRDVEKGLLLLDEIEDIFGASPSLEEMIATLWINFIEEYKAGRNKDALKQILILLKRYFGDEEI